MLVERYRPSRVEPDWVLAEDRYGTQAQVAVWRLPVADAGAALEARLEAWRSLDDPGLLQARALGSATAADGHFGLSAGQPYLVFASDALEGTEPWETIGPELTADQRLAVAVQLCWTLLRAHEAGVVLGVPAAAALRVRRDGDTARAAWVAPAPSASELSHDLLALGACLQAGLSTEQVAPADQLLTTLCQRLQDPVAERRPGAAETLQRLLEWAPPSTVRLGGAFPLPPLGREKVIDELLELAHARVGGDASAPAWALLEGEPGSGVTRVLREVERQLRLGGLPVVQGPSAPERGVVWIADLDQLEADARRGLLQTTRQSAVEQRPLLVVVAGCTLEATRAALEPLRAVAPPRVFALEPLERADLARLLESVLERSPPEPLLDTVERWSGGNPGRVRIALARLEEEGALVAGTGGWRFELEHLAGLPATLPDDADVFPPGATRDERRVLRGLCVSPHPITRAALESLAGLAQGAVEHATARLVETGVLAAEDDSLSFARARTRERLLASLSARDEHTLRQVHVAHLEQHEARGDALSALADHALALGDAQRAARYVPEAARADREAGAPLRALERRLAWRPLLSALDAQTRVEAWRDLGDALLTAGRVAAADEAFGSALATRSPKVAALTRVALHRRRAACALGRGDAATAAQTLQRARKALKQTGAGDPLEAQRLLGLEVQVALKAGDRGQVLTLTEAAFAGDAVDRGRGSLLNLRGLAHFHRGEPEQARRCFGLSLEISEQLDLQVGIAVVLGNLALVEDYEGNPVAAEELHRRSLEVARAAGIRGQTGTAANNLGNLANRAGRLAQARKRYREALACAGETADDEAVCMGLCALADTYLAQGDPQQARPYVDRALALAKAIGVPYCEALAQVNAADVLARLGSLGDALAAAERAVELRRELDEPARLARALALLARVAEQSGDAERAREAWGQASAALGADASPTAAGEVALGQPDPAALDRSEAAFRKAGDRLGVTRVGLARARSALLAGLHPSAASAAERAQAEADACGARALSAEAELVRLEAGSARDDRVLDRARAARSFAHRFGLPELARRAAGVLARLHDAREEPLEAGAARLDARRVLDAQCAGIPPALAKRLRARPDVLRDTQASEVVEAAAPPALRAPSPQPPGATSAPRLADCLAAAATLLRAPRCALLRTDADPPTLVAAHGAGAERGALTPAEANALAEDPPATTLVARVPGRPAALVVSRDEPFGPLDHQAANGLVVALAEHVPSAPEGSLRTLEVEPTGLLGRSPAIQAVRRQIERFGPHRLPVLIQGESGTGKELAARALHTASPWREGPFVAINASGFSAELVASELFGVARGAFTGANEDRPGIFELAHEGTLFLDEVADAPANLQAMLLRVLEEGEVRRVGGSEAIPVDVRVVCASLRDLAREVEAGAFRRDLYYRLCGLELRLPPLRDRAGDVGLLAEHVLARAAAEGRRSARLSPEALRRLEHYPWPGNVRELRNTLERALALGSGASIEVTDLALPAEDAQGEVPGSLSALEREAIVRALSEHATLTAAARSLGLHRRTLRRRMERYDLLDRS